jgi:hypothetical protein
MLNDFNISASVVRIADRTKFLDEYRTSSSSFLQDQGSEASEPEDFDNPPPPDDDDFSGEMGYAESDDVASFAPPSDTSSASTPVPGEESDLTDSDFVGITAEQRDYASDGSSSFGDHEDINTNDSSDDLLGSTSRVGLQKRRRIHITGDREIIGRGSGIVIQSDDEEESGRARRSKRHCEPVQYARIRRSYKRKT